MQIGDCPHCGAVMIYQTPDQTPVFSRVECDTCLKPVWLYLSRLDPMAYTQEGFEQDWELLENGVVRRKEESGK
jgi:hypothetical protein